MSPLSSTSWQTTAFELITNLSRLVYVAVSYKNNQRKREFIHMGGILDSKGGASKAPFSQQIINVGLRVTLLDNRIGDSDSMQVRLYSYTFSLNLTLATVV
jgi:hypothetical protein